MTSFKNKKILLIAIYFVLAIFSQMPTMVNGQVLPAESQERKQLIAMGYEIDAEDKNDVWTIARLGSTSIGFTKSKERLAVLRTFSIEKNLSTDEKQELHKEVNRVNHDLSFQTIINEDSISFVLYDFGDYTPKTFAKIVRLAEQANSVFDSHPKLYELLKK
jgi:hypothetical protein